MARKFSLNREETQEKTLEDRAIILEKKSEFDLRFINIDNLIPNEKNFYELSNIRELADNIREFGLNQNLEVLEIEDGTMDIENKKYRLIGGHRRLEALKMLVAEGETRFEKVPCKVDKGLDEIEERLRLIKSNSDTRELSPAERRKQIEEMTALYTKRAELMGEKKQIKEINKEVAEATGTYEKTVERYKNINNRLIPELQEYFDSSKITYTEAYNWATLDETAQKAILALLQTKDKVTKEEIKAIKEANKKLTDENEKAKRELEEKEAKIENLQNEYSELEQQQSSMEIEKEVLEEEREKLESKIREEMAQLSEEELNKARERAEKLEEEAKKLEKEHKKLSEKIAKKDKEIEEYKQKLEEEKTQGDSKSSDISQLSEEQLKEAVNRSKISSIRSEVMEKLDYLLQVSKESSLIDEAEQTLTDIEKTIEEIKSTLAL